VTRDTELDEIARFLASGGARRCPPAFAAPLAATGLSRAEEARRLERLQLKGPPTKAEVARVLWGWLARGRQARS
jgi:hypothetical protein